MNNLLNDYDSDKNALLNPSHSIVKTEDFPKIAISTFSHLLIDHFVKNNNAEVIAELGSANGKTPVYKIIYKNTPLAVYMSHVGAPSSAAMFEEMIAYGTEKMLLFGSCGVLRHEITDGAFVVPTSAMRDEGTSYHYQPPSDEIALDTESVRVITETLTSFNLPYVTGKTWTTDAFYRETRAKFDKRKEQGCIVVEMECAAMTAVAKFREVKFGQFLFSADNLDNTVWDPRSLRNKGVDYADQYMAVALEIAIKL